MLFARGANMGICPAVARAVRSSCLVIFPRPVVFAAESTVRLLRRVLPPSTVFVRNRRELFGASFTPGAVAFVDYDLLETIEGGKIDIPIVAIMNVSAHDALIETVRALGAFSWLAHVIQAPLLSLDRAGAHLELLLKRLVSGGDPSPLGRSAVGRSAFIARASKRSARFDRMREFFETQGLPERLVTTLMDVGEELVMNGLYDAPKDGGFHTEVHSRNEDVELPPERACEISYGIEDANAFVRLRDPFGALTRERLIQVLSRCAVGHGEVEIDPSRGGAGLGMWRIFSAASTLAVTVVPGSITDVTVSIGKNDSRRLVRPLAVDLYFADAPRTWSLAGDEDSFLVDNSFTLAIGESTPTPSPC